MSRSQAFTALFTILLLAFGGLLVGQTFSWFIAQAAGLTFSKVADLLQDPANIGPLLWMQLGYAATLFIGVPLFFLALFDKYGLKQSLQEPWVLPGATRNAFMIVCIVLVYLPLSGYLVTLNKQMTLPWADLDAMLRQMEEELARTSAFMTNFASFPQFLLGLLVIALIPGIGEELMFRGLIQPIMQKLLNNVHLGIWVTAALFSAFHLQFYGFLPRMALGALFGYLCLWSGSLRYAMLAHFFNNGLTLTIMYLYNQGALGISIDELESVSWVWALPSLMATAALCYWFAKHANHSKLTMTGLPAESPKS